MGRTPSIILTVVLFAAAAVLLLRLSVRHFVQDRAESVAALPQPPLQASPRAQASCRSNDLKLQIPLMGEAEKDWVIANYVDLDPVVGKIRDYTGAVDARAVSYDGHTGIDFEVASFREVDRGTVVVASGDGVVEETYDQSFDRNRTCSMDRWNYVKLRHGNGFATYYGHMKKSSVMVHLGDRVSAGAPLGLVGSSGCSSYPHVHLEVLDCLGQVVEPLQAGLFQDPPRYSRDADSKVMEVIVFQPVIESYTSLQDPGPEDVAVISRGAAMSVGATISHLRAGDLIRIELITPDNSAFAAHFEQSVTDYLTRSHWWGNFTPDRTGLWIAQVKVNGIVRAEKLFNVGE